VPETPKGLLLRLLCSALLCRAARCFVVDRGPSLLWLWPLDLGSVGLSSLGSLALAGAGNRHARSCNDVEYHEVVVDPQPRQKLPARLLRFTRAMHPLRFTKAFPLSRFAMWRGAGAVLLKPPVPESLPPQPWPPVR